MRVQNGVGLLERQKARAWGGGQSTTGGCIALLLDVSLYAVLVWGMVDLGNPEHGVGNLGMGGGHKYVVWYGMVVGMGGWQGWAGGLAQNGRGRGNEATCCA